MLAGKNYWGSILKQVLIGSITICTIIGFIIGDWLYRDTESKLFTELRHTASVLTQYYKQAYYYRELNLTSIGYRLLDIKGANQDSLRLALARRYLDYNTELSAFGLADPSGQLITFTGHKAGVPDPNLMVSDQSRRSFLEVTKADGLVIGEVYFFKELNKWILPIRIPLRDRQDNLKGVNTCAIPYENLIDELAEFNFNPEFRIHTVNAIHKSTQLYYPLDSTLYHKYLGKELISYVDTLFAHKNKNVTEFRAKNSLDGELIIGVKTLSAVFNHYLVVTASRAYQLGLFYARGGYVLFIYISLIIILILGYRYLTQKEFNHNKQLLRQKKYSEDIIEGSPALIVGVDAKGICTFTNAAALNSVGYSKEEIVGKSWWSTLYPDQYYDQVLKLFEDVKHGDVKDYEMALVRKDGIVLTVSWNSLRFFHSDGRLKEIVGFGFDITELKQAQNELKKHAEDLEGLVSARTEELLDSNQALLASNDKLKEQHEVLKNTLENLKNTQKQLFQADKMASLGLLVAGVGHEINNPLNFIQGGIQGLKKLDSSSNTFVEDGKPFYQIIEEGVSRAATIVKSLSHFSRKNVEMEEQCDLHQIIDNCLTILQNKLKHKVIIEKNFTGKEVMILGSGGKLHQAILNVLSNAEQAIIDNGKIIITTSVIDNKIRVSIKDTGIGIEESNLSKIGDPFFTTKEVGDGTGLGLSITYSIVEEHHGTIELKSKLGVGSEFILIFPVQ